MLRHFPRRDQIDELRHRVTDVQHVAREIDVHRHGLGRERGLLRSKDVEFDPLTRYAIGVSWLF